MALFLLQETPKEPTGVYEYFDNGGCEETEQQRKRRDLEAWTFIRLRPAVVNLPGDQLIIWKRRARFHELLSLKMKSPGNLISCRYCSFFFYFPRPVDKRRERPTSSQLSILSSCLKIKDRGGATEKGKEEGEESTQNVSQHPSR